MKKPCINKNSIKTKSSNLLFQKRISSRVSAVATVEAAVIFPVIIFFFISIIWFVQLFLIHSEIGGELNLIGNEMVAYSYPYNHLTGADSDETLNLVSSVGWNELYVKGRIEKLNVAGKISSLTTLLSDYESQDIDIVVTYAVNPVLEIPGLRHVILTNHFNSKAYIGYGKVSTEEKRQEQEIVYITKNGEVYHDSLSCQALKTTISSVDICDVENKRNKDGAKYYQCSKCKSENCGSTVYITPYGNRYHNSLECSDLNTDVHAVYISDVGDKRHCRFCERGGSK